MKRASQTINIKPILLVNIICGLSVGILFVLFWGNLWWLGFGLGTGLAVGSYSILKRLKDIEIIDKK